MFWGGIEKDQWHEVKLEIAFKFPMEFYQI